MNYQQHIQKALNYKTLRLHVLVNTMGYHLNKFHTKQERNGLFVYESVPGTAVTDLNVFDGGMTFKVEGPEDAQITVEMEAETEYKVLLDGVNVGHMTTNLGGKLSFSVELEKAGDVAVEIVKA